MNDDPINLSPPDEGVRVDGLSPLRPAVPLPDRRDNDLGAEETQPIRIVEGLDHHGLNRLQQIEQAPEDVGVWEFDLVAGEERLKVLFHGLLSMVSIRQSCVVGSGDRSLPGIPNQNATYPGAPDRLFSASV
jgi:hypothetical protein